MVHPSLCVGYTKELDRRLNKGKGIFPLSSRENVLVTIWNQGLLASDATTCAHLLTDGRSFVLRLASINLCRRSHKEMRTMPKRRDPLSKSGDRELRFRAGAASWMICPELSLPCTWNIWVQYTYTKKYIWGE
mmetsp:Transcript_14134/g.32703  ORF Transcript_14134/g.32703 Transcript_14134/m.32703 type:complete len:133 (-) Transcript_14134:4769-5167(-)